MSADPKNPKVGDRFVKSAPEPLIAEPVTLGRPQVSYGLNSAWCTAGCGPSMPSDATVTVVGPFITLLPDHTWVEGTT